MAGNKIKGITIEINGETGPLQNALKGVNKTSYDLQTELKQVNNQLKFDPSNTTLLAQKQELLAKSITNTKEKLVTLKSAEQQAQAQFARGEISAEQYRALTREVIKTESQLGNLEEQAGKSDNALQKAAKAGSKIGDKLIVAGVAAVGTGLVAATVAGITMGDQLSKALNGVQAATGTSDKAMGSYKDTMLAIYNDNFGESFEDIGTAMTTIAQKTGLTGNALKAMTEDALTVRDTFQIEVEDSVKGADMMMKQFGVSGKEAYNLIAQGAQSGLNANGDLMDTIQEYSATFSQQGFSADEFFNMLSNGTKAGIKDTDLMSDAIKEFGIRSKDSSKTTIDAFQSLGLDSDKLTKSFNAGGTEGKKAFEQVAQKIKGIKDPAEQMRIAVELFGTQAEDMGIKGVLAMMNTKGATDKTKDALKGINEVKYNSFGESVEGIKRQLITGLAIPIGEKLLPKMNEFANELKQKLPSAIATVKPIMESLLDKIAFLASHLNIVIPIIGAVVAAMVTMSIVNKVAQFVTTLTKVMSLLSLAKLKDIAQTGILNALYAKDTILKAAKMVGEFAAKMALMFVAKAKDITQTLISNALYVKDAIVKGASAVAQVALTVATAAWSIVCGIATAVTTGLGIAFAFLTSPIGLIILAIAAVIAIGVLLYKNWDTIKAKAAPIFTAIGAIIKTAFTAIATFITFIWGGIKAGLVITFTVIKNLFTMYVTFWKVIITTAFNIIKTVITTILNAIKTIITVTFTVIKNLFTMYVTIWKTIITVAFNAIKTVITTVINAIKAVITTVFNAIKAVISSVFNTIRSVTSSAWNGIKSVTSGAVNGIKSTVSNVFNSLKSVAINAFNGMKNGISNTLSGLGGAIRSGFSSAINFIRSLPGQALGWGRDFISGLISGIRSMIGGITSAVSSVANTIKSFLHFSVPDEGPLTDYESWMPDFMGGLAKGIANSKSLVTNAIKGLSTDMSIGMQLSPSQLGSAPLSTRNNQTNQGAAQNINSSQTINVPVYLDGKQIAKVIAPFSDVINGNVSKLTARGQGL